MSEIQARVAAEVKAAMKARDKDRVAALRLVMAEFKRVEVDERIELDDDRVLAELVVVARHLSAPGPESVGGWVVDSASLARRGDEGRAWAHSRSRNAASGVEGAA